ncbi:MAG: hypothetical protein FJY79_06380 [Candidatus Aminicenantes bacterium]|nr:hypothetical protein [Candidatus Aminicenantes bacterium]
MRKTYLIAALVALTAVSGCAKYTIVPPAINLMDHADLGMIAFRAEGVQGDLGGLAAQLFLEEITRAQRVPVVEMGAPADVLGKIGRQAFDRDAAKAVGAEYGVRSYFFGEVAISKVKPQIDLAAPSVKSLFVRATFDISMTVRLVSAESGATIWTESTRREGTVGALSMGPNGVPSFGIRDKNEAMHSLLRDMSYQLTWDFRPTRRRL